MSACRSCFAEIIWCSTWKGKLIPVDAEPTAVDEPLRTTVYSHLGEL